MIASRRMSFLDRLLTEANHALNTIFSQEMHATRKTPAADVPESDLTPQEKRHSAGLMRVDHTGEVCAQALYRGQALWARTEDVRLQLLEAADEEQDHLTWCQERLKQLDDRPSHLNIFWYGASFGIGLIASMAGDRWSLGFVAETEEQVGRHLEKHLNELPASDGRSRAILMQMQEDELRHRDHARENGGAPLPFPIQMMMKLQSKVMTTLAYYV